MRLFTKSPDKKQKNENDKDKDKDKDSSPSSPKPRSPLKKSDSSTSSRSASARVTVDENHKQQPSSRPKSHKSRSRRSPDLDTHPLNLPKEEREFASKRFSAMSMMSDPMELDSEAQAPSSPAPQPTMPGAFDVPKTNGTSSSSKEEPPVPPPHKSNPTSPIPPPAPTPEEAEVFKAAGNKFYKSKEYRKAIDEYTKGMPSA